MKINVHTAIIGSGITGLSLAHFLSKKSKDFVVLESKNKTGGIIQTEIKNNFVCENGPNTVLLNNDAIIELIKDYGMYEKIILPNVKNNKNRFLLYNDQLTPIPTSILKFLFTPLLSISGKMRFLAELFIKKHESNTTVYEFVCKRFGKEFHDKFIVPFITGIYASDTKNMSVKHSLKILWKLEQENGSIIKGLMKSKKKSASSFNFSLGLSELISKIEENLKSQIKLNFKATKILKKENGYEVISDDETIICDRLICAIPAYSLKNIVFSNCLKDALSKVKYNPVDVFHFGFYKKNIHKMKKGFGVLTKPSDHKKYLGILFNSQIFSHVSQGNKELFTVLVGGERQKELCNLKKESLEIMVLNELESLIDHRGEVILKNHFRWKNGIPQYDMGQESLINSIEEFESKNKGIYIIGNYFNGISVSDSVLKSKMLIKSL